MEIKDQLRRDQSELLRALQSAGANVEKPKAMKCPFHDDQHPSAGVYEREDGVWAFKCHVCGVNFDVFDVMAKNQGKPVEEILRSMSAPRTVSKAPRRLYKTIQDMEATQTGFEATYAYGANVVEMVVIRSKGADGRKKFIQAHPVPGGFVMEAPAKPWPLYNLSRVTKSDRVVVVEGEKCVRALHEIGIVATTSPGGAKNAKNADWSHLNGKRVYLWPDNDESGFGYTEDVKAMLEKTEAVLYEVDIPSLGLPKGGDVADLLADNGGGLTDKQTVVELILAGAKPLNAADDVVKWIADVGSGKISCIDWPWPKLSRFAKALYPGSIVIIPGAPDGGKSLLTLQSFWHWHELGIKVALFELEKDSRFHLTRVMAQMAACSGLAGDEWVKEHPTEALDIAERFRERVASFSRRMWDDRQHQKTLGDLGAWVEEMAAAGCRVIGIDPITAARYERRDSWNEDQNFILRADQAITKHGSSLVLVTHPRTGGKSADSGMDNMAGGRAYSRFTDSVLYLERHFPAKEARIRYDMGTQAGEISRSIQIRKARNGIGAGMEIGFNFDASSLCFAEQGVVVNEKER